MLKQELTTSKQIVEAEQKYKRECKRVNEKFTIKFNDSISK
jgi:hypothetical protein